MKTKITNARIICNSGKVLEKADIAVVEGDPLEDIEAAKNVKYTFCNGKLLYCNM